MKRPTNPASILTKDQNRLLVLTILQEIADERDAEGDSGDPIEYLINRLSEYAGCSLDDREHSTLAPHKILGPATEDEWSRRPH